MKTRRGWVQGYNAQIVVTQDQIILTADVTTQANDVGQLTPMLDQAQANAAAVIEENAGLGRTVANAGCWSEANVDRRTEECKLRTKRGRETYRRCSVMVESVFGQMKNRQGTDPFSMRGLDQCRERDPDAAVHNFRRLHRDSVCLAASGPT